MNSETRGEGFGVYDYGARWYDPALGRFLQPDPLVGALFDPQSLNRYSYVRNDPMNFVDPTGMQGIGAGAQIPDYVEVAQDAGVVPTQWVSPLADVNADGSSTSSPNPVTGIVYGESGFGPNIAGSVNGGSGAIEGDVQFVLNGSAVSNQVKSGNKSETSGGAGTDLVDVAGKAVGVAEIIVSVKELVDDTPGEIAKASKAVAGAGIAVGLVTTAQGVHEDNTGKAVVGAGETAAGIRALSLARAGTMLTPAGFAINVAISGGMILFENQLVDRINSLLGDGGESGADP